MRFRRTTGAAALLLTAIVLGACGEDGSKKELSNQTAASLRSTLEDVERSVESQDCTGAIQEVSSLRATVEGLPGRVDGDLRDALSASARRLETLVADQCQAEQQAPAPEAPAGTTSEEGAKQPQGDEDQTGKPKKDKKPKKEKPNQDEQPAPETGGAGQEDPGLDEQGGATVPPGQE